MKNQVPEPIATTPTREDIAEAEAILRAKEKPLPAFSGDDDDQT